MKKTTKKTENPSSSRPEARTLSESEVQDILGSKQHVDQVKERACDALVDLTHLAHYNKAGAEALFDHVCAACDKLGYILLDRRELLGHKLHSQTFVPTIHAKDPDALTTGLSYLVRFSEEINFRGGPPVEREWPDDGPTLQSVFHHFVHRFANGIKPDPRNTFETVMARKVAVDAKTKRTLLMPENMKPDKWAKAFIKWLKKTHPELMEKQKNTNWRSVDWNVSQGYPRGVIWLYGEKLVDRPKNSRPSTASKNPRVRLQQDARDYYRKLMKRYPEYVI